MEDNLITLHKSTLSEFPMDNGYGVLRDAIYAFAEEEMNGLLEFEMEYDSQGVLVGELKEERIIKAKASDRLGMQLFRIYRVEKNHDADSVTVFAQHITYDLAYYFVEKLELSNVSKQQVLQFIGQSTSEPHPFNLTSPNTTTMSSTSLYRNNPLQMVAGTQGSVLQIWGGQIERDNFDLVMHDRRGTDEGFRVTYEKNITGLQADFDISEVYTRFYPFYIKEATEDEPEKVITIEGKFIDSDLINNYGFVRVLPLDYSGDERFGEDDTEEFIQNKLVGIVEDYIEYSKPDQIKTSFEVEFAHLWETEEYKDIAVLERVGMGDSVYIDHTILDVEAEAIVNYIKYDCIAEINEEVKLGSVRSRTSDSLGAVDGIIDKVEDALRNSTNAVISANGKNMTYDSPTPPTGNIREGDLWFEVVDGDYRKTWRFDGIEWQLIIDMDSEEAKQLAQDATDRADEAMGKADNAIAESHEALDKAQEGFDMAQDALTEAGSVSGKADQALSESAEAYNKAQDALLEASEAGTKSDQAITDSLEAHEKALESLDRADESYQKAMDSIGLSDMALGQSSEAFDEARDAFAKAQENATSIDGLALRITGRNMISHIVDLSNVGEHWNSGYNASYDITQFLKVDIGYDEDAESYVYKGTRLESDTTYTVKSYFSEDITFTNIDSALVTWISEDGELTPTQEEMMEFREIFANGESFTFHTPVTSRDLHFVMVFTVEGDHTDALGTDLRIKLEKGDTATPWTLYDEDPYEAYTTITATVDGIQTEVTDIEGNLSTVTQTVQGVQTDVSNLEGDVSSVTQMADGLQTDVSNLDGDVSSVTQLANGLQSNVSNISGDLSSVTQLADGLQSRVLDAEGNISTLQQTAGSLYNQISSTNSRIDELDSDDRNLISHLPSAWEQGWIGVTGNMGVNSTTIRYKEYAGVEGNTEFTLTKYPEDGHTFKLYIIFFNNVNEAVGSEYLNPQTNVLTFTSPSSATKYKFSFADYTVDGVVQDISPDMVSTDLRLKMQYGDKTSDWTPNFNDTGELVNSVQTFVSEFQQTADSLSARISDNFGNINTLFLTNDSLISSIQNAFGEVNEVRQTANALQSRLSTAEGDLSTVTQTANALQSRLSTAEGDITSVTQTANALQSRVEDAEGNLSSITQTVGTHTSQIQNADGRISSLTQTVNGLNSTVTDLEVGTRNLLIPSVMRYVGNGHSADNRTLTFPNSSSRVIYEFYDNTQLKKNTDYVFHIESASTGLEWGVFFERGTRTLLGYRRDNALHFNTGDREDFQLVIRATSSNQTAYRVSLVMGNKYGGWQEPYEFNNSKFSAINQDIDSISTRVQTNANNYSAISQTVSGITSRVHANENNFSALSQTVNSIASRVQENMHDFSALTQTVSGLQTEVNKKVNTTTYNSKVTQLSDAINTKISEKDANGTFASKTELDLTARVLRASVTDLEDSTMSALTLIDTNINLRFVRKGDVKAQLNLDNSGVLLQGKHLMLDGDTTVNGSFRVKNANIESLNAGKLTAGTLDANKVSIVNLNVNSLTGNKSTFVETAWNSISSQVKMSSRGMESFSGGNRTSLLNGDGHHFYRSNVRVGTIGTGTWAGYPSYRGLRFGLEPGANYMNWGYKNTSADDYITVFSWHRNGSVMKKGFTFSDDVTIRSGVSLSIDKLKTLNGRGVLMRDWTINDVDGVMFARDDNSNTRSGVFMANTVAMLVGRNVSSGTIAHIEAVGTTTGGYIRSKDIYDRTYTATSQLVRVTNNGILGRSTSSRRYKLCEKPQGLDYAKRIHNVTAKSWYDRIQAELYSDYLTNTVNGEDTPDDMLPEEKIERIGGVIAEDVHDAGLEMFVNYDDEGRPEGVSQYLWTLILPIVKEHEEELESLNHKIDVLQGMLEQIMLNQANNEEN